MRRGPSDWANFGFGRRRLDDHPGAGAFEDLSRAIVATAAGRGHPGLTLKHLEALRARSHLAVDVAVRDAVAQADDHGAQQASEQRAAQSIRNKNASQ